MKPSPALRHVFSHRDIGAICDIADEVDRVFGFACTQVSLSSVGPSALYINGLFPTSDRAFQYARELVDAAQTSRAAYDSALRR